MTDTPRSADETVVVFVTAGSAEEGTKIARAAVEAELAACGNLVPAIRSIYSWKGELQDDAEVLLILKTRGDLVADLMQCVRELHSYEVAEFLALPVAVGAEDYLAWVRDVTRAPTKA